MELFLEWQNVFRRGLLDKKFVLKDKAATATAGNRGFWLPPRDSNPDTLLQRQMSYR